MNEVGSGAGGGTTETESDEMLRTRPNTIKRSTPTGEYAVRGARIECDCGNGFDVVNIPLCHGVYSGDYPLVSIKDMKVGENICNGFGVCITPEGEKFDCKKEIQINNEWINENKVRFHIDGEEVLATGAITMCSKHGGGIRVVESGQNGKYMPQSTDEVNVSEKRNMMNSLGEGADSIKDVPEIPAAILAGLTTIDACEAKIKELGQMWHDADGNPALQEYYHRQANQIREHILVLGKTAPVSKEYLESVKRQLGSVDGSDELLDAALISSTVDIHSLYELKKARANVTQEITVDDFNYLLKEIPTSEIEARQYAYKYASMIDSYVDNKYEIIGRGIQIDASFFVGGGAIDIIKFEKEKFGSTVQDKILDEEWAKPYVYITTGVDAGLSSFEDTITMGMEFMKNAKKTKVKPGFSVSMLIVARYKDVVKETGYDPDKYNPDNYTGISTSEEITLFHVKFAQAMSEDKMTKVDSMGVSTSKFDVSIGTTCTILVDKKYTDMIFETTTERTGETEWYWRN